MISVLTLPQGSEEWKNERRKWATASDMASILGVKGAFSSRKKLLLEKKSGAEKALTDFEVALFARGHVVERELQPWLEHKLGMKFESVVLLDEESGILASLDYYNKQYGIVIDGKNSTSEKKLSLARNYQMWEPYSVQVVTQMMLAKADIGFLCMHDDTCDENYLIPVEYDAKLADRITTEAKKFVAELRSMK